MQRKSKKSTDRNIVLFCHDHCFTEIDGRWFSPGKIVAADWERFLLPNWTVTVVARCQIGSGDSRGLELSSRSSVKFALFPTNKYLYLNLLLTWSREHRALRAHVRDSAFVVARLPSRIGYAAIRECRRLNKPYGVEIVGSALDAYKARGSWPAWLLAHVSHVEMKNAVASACGAVYVTKHYLQQQYPTNKIARAQAISNVNLQTSPPSMGFGSNDAKSATSAARADSTFVIGFVGAVSLHYKGFDVLVRALGLLSDEFQVELMVAGSELEEVEAFSASRARIKQRYHALGTLDGAGLWEFYYGLDLLIVPSRTEGMPRVAIEALSTGTEVIGSDVGGLPEILSGDRIFKNGDSCDLARKIRRFLTLRPRDPDFYQSIRADFDCQRLADDRREFWCSLIRSTVE